MEEHVGHYTYFQNLRQYMDFAPSKDTTRIEMTFNEAYSLWGRLPGLPSSVRGVLVGNSQLRNGLSWQPALEKKPTLSR
jgi:hypothetical protein